MVMELLPLLLEKGHQLLEQPRQPSTATASINNSDQKGTNRWRGAVTCNEQQGKKKWWGSVDGQGKQQFMRKEEELNWSMKTAQVVAALKTSPSLAWVHRKMTGRRRMKITATGNTVREKELRRQGEEKENSPWTAMAAGGKGDSNVNCHSTQQKQLLHLHRHWQ